MVGTETMKDSPMQLAADRDGKLYNMILTWTWNQRKEPDTEVKELVSSLPVVLVTFFLHLLKIQYFTKEIEYQQASDIKTTPKYEEIFWQAIEEEVPDDVKLQQLSKAMYQDEKEKAKNKFCELLSSLSPELVSS